MRFHPLQRLTFRMAHASTLHPSRRAIWYLHEHSARLAALDMTEEKWREHQQLMPMKTVREVMRWQAGPRWAVVADLA